MMKLTKYYQFTRNHKTSLFFLVGIGVFVIYKIQMQNKTYKQQSSDQNINNDGKTIKHEQKSLESSGHHDQPPQSFSNHSQNNHFNKTKIIKKKSVSILQKAPNSDRKEPRVFNFMNMIPINLWTLSNRDHNQSFFKSFFYIKSVEKVETRKNAIVIYTKPLFHSLTNIDEIILNQEQHQSKGLEELSQKVREVSRLCEKVKIESELQKSYQPEALARFIDTIQNKLSFCFIYPNKLILTTKLVEFLGEDPEILALRLCKVRAPLQQIFSTANYYLITLKWLANIKLVCDFLTGRMRLEQLYAKSEMKFESCLLGKQRKMNCLLSMSMPNPLTTCFQVKQNLGIRECNASTSDSHLLNLCETHREMEAETVNKMLPVPKKLLPIYREHTASYRTLASA